MPENVSRRNLIQILGVAPAAAAVAGAANNDGAHGAHGGMNHAGMNHAAMNHAGTGQQGSEYGKGPYKRRVFDDHQWQTVHVLSDLIIPADESGPSATGAGVPEFLDEWVAFRTEQDGNLNFQAEMLGGLMWLDHESNKLTGKDFVDAGDASQRQLLDRIAYPKKAAANDAQGVAFFSQLRSLVVSGYFSSKAGVKALPYLGNVAVMQWKGCDPKVWSIIEDRMKNGYKGVLEAKPWGTKAS